MTWTPELDREFNEAFAVMDDAERFAMTSPRKREPLTLAEWVFAICGTGITLCWAAFLCLAGYGLFQFVWDLGVKLFHR